MKVAQGVETLTSLASMQKSKELIHNDYKYNYGIYSDYQLYRKTCKSVKLTPLSKEEYISRKKELNLNASGEATSTYQKDEQINWYEQYKLRKDEMKKSAMYP